MKWLFVLAACSQVAFASDMPVNPAVTQDTIKETICVVGWTRTVRPPVNYTNKIKRAKMDEQALPWERADEFELDHVVPLTLGGAPRDADNLKLQLWPEARVKDKLEVRLNHLVCAGLLGLEEAQRCIWGSWKQCSKIHQAEML